MGERGSNLGGVEQAWEENQRGNHWSGTGRAISGQGIFCLKGRSI